MEFYCTIDKLWATEALKERNQYWEVLGQVEKGHVIRRKMDGLSCLLTDVTEELKETHGRKDRFYVFHPFILLIIDEEEMPT